MTKIDCRLTGKQATAKAIQAMVNRHLHEGKLERIEVRLSTQPVHPTNPSEVRKLLSQLLGQHGLGAVELSLRHLDSALDDAMGEHLVRLIFAPIEAAPAIVNDAASGWWQRLWRWLPGRRATPRPAGRLEPALKAVSGISPKRAVELLRESLSNAVRIEATGLQGKPVASVNIVARLPEIHATLKAMMPPINPGSAQSLAQWLQRDGQQTQPELIVSYRFEPYDNGDTGTAMVIRCDLETHLSPDAGSRTKPAPETSNGPARSAETALSGDAADQGTAMPLRPRREFTAPRAALRIRLRGTLAGDFPQPFDLLYRSLPACFDRATLKAAGFGFRHGLLLAVASQGSPLLVEASPEGLRLRPGVRPDGQPMYFRHDNQAPLTVSLLLGNNQASLAVVVNAVQGVCLTSGIELSPLVIELLPDPGAADPLAHSAWVTADPATALPMAGRMAA
ncbi:hypothetical protein [Propionivibrio sp.]|uniref:hypothetical protein n=1 Tax=Propionivibrio sp. TaxID=2212460 RepID=UPI003BF38899